jgi:peptide/nickel transport system substrate-binding protein
VSERHRLTRLVALLAVLAVAVAACGSSKKTAKPGSTATTAAGSTSAGKPVVGGTLTVGLESNVSSLDPAHGLAQPADVDIALGVYDPIAAFDKAGKTIPYLAKTIEGSADLKTWTATFPTGITFQDGTPFNADAVVAHFKRLKDPATQCSCAGDVAPITSVTAKDANTVVFVLDKPNVAFPDLLAASTGLVESPTAIQKEGPDYGLHPVGTGPFSLTEFKVGDHVTLVKNPNYWRKDADGNRLPYLDKIVFKPITDTKVRLATIEAGGVDLMQTADPSGNAEALAKGLKLEKISGTSSTISIFNTKKPPFDDVIARQAVAYATDRAALNAVVYNNTRKEAYSQFAVGSPYYDTKGLAPHYDLKKAQLLVKQYSQKHGTPLKFTFECISGSTESTQGLQLFQQAYKQAGMDVTLKFTDQGAFVADKFNIGKQDYQMACFRDSQFADPDALYADLHTGGGGNVTNYSNPTVDKALELSRATADFSKRKAAFDKVQEIVSKELPAFPTLYDIFTNVYRPTVHNLPPGQANSLGAIFFTQVWLSK